MPLRDHFHSPLSALRHWESFHARWATAIADLLEGELLPPGYFAEVQVHVGRVEVDVATFDEGAVESVSKRHDAESAVSTAVSASKTWAPPSPDMTMPAVFPDRLEVLIYNTESGPTLVSAIELVSPRNKDRAESRRAFAVKLASYLQLGIGLLVIDVVTNRLGNLHNDLVDLLELPDWHRIDSDSPYVLTYRAVQHEQEPLIEVWHKALSIGEPLPILPLPLDKGQWVRLDLERAYSQTAARMRLPAE